MPDCWIGIGANTGDARAAFDAAWQHLSGLPSVQLLRRSGLYQTTPVGQNSGSTYTNAAFSLTTSMSPLELLDALQAIENDLGRTRDQRWGPRPIDLDLLFIDQMVLDEPRLRIPHPGAWYRRFVLDPIVEIAPTLIHAQLNKSTSELLQLLSSRPFLVGFFDPVLPVFLASLCDRFPDVKFVAAGSGSAKCSAWLCLRQNEAVGTWHGTPIADLTMVPGDVPQRVIDFLTAALDNPVRTGDW